MNEYLTKCFDIYVSQISQNLSDSTILNKYYYSRCYLESLGDSFDSFDHYDISYVYSYIDDLNFASQTKCGVKFTLREFFNVMYRNDITHFDDRQIFPVIFTNKRDRIPSYYEPEEIRKIIQIIDLSKVNGVRDKCMILLAAQTGLRTSDITCLRFGEILWDKNMIQKTQQKTKLSISVPLPLNIKFLLIDYIKNHRPCSDEDFVFICEKTHKHYCNSQLYSILNSYIKKSDVMVGNRKHGPHALRHSLATNLLKENTPMPVITGLLGHKNINTTSRYMAIDIESLRSLCLEVDPYEK